MIWLVVIAMFAINWMIASHVQHSGTHPAADRAV